MEKLYVINRIKELCNKKNDREIALDFSYNNRIFHAKYLFLGNDLYITDTLNVIELKDLDMGCLLYTSPSPRDGLLSRMPSSA